MVDNATGGAVGEKTAEETYNLYELLGFNSQQRGGRRRARVNDVGSDNEITLKLDELTKQVQLLTTHQMTNQEVYEVCFSIGHDTHNCSYTCDSRVDSMEVFKRRM